jgi:DNA-binding MarR family transcriptional regulator
MKEKTLDKTIDEMTKEKNRLLACFIDKYSLGNGQFQILNEVAWNEGISQEGVVRKLNIDKSACAKSVKGLIENGFIYKIRDEQDKRAYCLHCTSKGIEMIPMIRDIITKVDGILTYGIDDSEIGQFSKMCQRITKNAKCYLADKRESAI